MKTVKRFFAIAVAVLLIAMMIPTAFAGTASDPNTVSWTCSKPGYTYTVYKVAGYNADDGSYPLANNVTGITAAQVKNAVTADEMAALADACKTATLPAEGTTFTTNEGSGSFKLANGIYYIKCTGEAANSKGVTTESIVVFPNKNGTTTETIDFAGKLDEGQPKCYKSFLINGTETRSEQSFGSNDTITYRLKADIPGTADNKLTSYVIVDKMGAGLDASVHTIKSVYLQSNNTKVRDITAYEVSTASSVINRVKADTIDGANETTGNTFGVSIKAAELNKNDFYGEGKQVVVEFETKLATNAAVATAIPNDDDMIYGNASGFNVVDGQQVTLKTYEIKAKKVDANTGAAITTQDAEFTLYKEDGTTVIATATTDANGIASFGVKLAAGTYVVKETAAPTGYNLNSTPQTVTVGTTGTVTVTIEDTPAKLPATGGAGTLVFTIVGGSLVLLAAVLFIIVMKKRSSAK